MNLVKYYLHIDLEPLAIFISKNEIDYLFLIYNNYSIIWRHVPYVPETRTKIEINENIFNYLLKSKTNKLKDSRYCSSISEILKKLEIYDLVCESLI